MNDTSLLRSPVPVIVLALDWQGCTEELAGPPEHTESAIGELERISMSVACSSLA